MSTVMMESTKAPDRSAMVQALETIANAKNEVGQQHVAVIIAAAEAEAQTRSACESAARNHQLAKRAKRDALAPLVRREAELKAALSQSAPPEIRELIDRIDRAIAAVQGKQLPTTSTAVAQGDHARPTVESICDPAEVRQARARLADLRQLRERAIEMTYQDDFSTELVEANQVLDSTPKPKRRFFPW